jgi:hypothetical protein
MIAFMTIKYDANLLNAQSTSINSNEELKNNLIFLNGNSYQTNTIHC